MWLKLAKFDAPFAILAHRLINFKAAFPPEKDGHGPDPHF
jgi:hypothetical protein